MGLLMRTPMHRDPTIYIMCDATLMIMMMATPIQPPPPYTYFIHIDHIVGVVRVL